MGELHDPWIELRRCVLRFEHALALIPSGLISPDMPVSRLLSEDADPVIYSAVRQICDAIVQMREMIPSRHQRLVSSLMGTLCRRMDATELRIDVYTRLALWERLWLSLVREQTSQLSVNACWNRCVDYSVAISHIGWRLKNDLYWSPAHVQSQRDSFGAEEAIVALINQSSVLTSLSATVAPLDADVLHGLDLSLKRSKPPARAWIQFSLSAEEGLNTKKLRQLKRSAAVALLSPWTLARDLRDRTQAQQAQVWRALATTPPRDLQAQSRVIAQALELLFDHINADRHHVDIAPLSHAHQALSDLIISFLQEHIGRKAARSYRPHKKLPPVSDILEVELNQLLGSFHSQMT